MVVEISVRLKDDSRTYKENFVHYNNSEGIISWTQEDPTLQGMVHEACTNFKGEPSDITVKAEMFWVKV